MKNIKKFTILHSNDMHGDFLAEKGKEKLIGGLALLSGYINKVRKEEKNVLYVIAGDMLQGSVIDTEYKGISTVDIMNYLAPDVVALGNHEFDYGLPHLLFLEKVANFPIVNANLYIKSFNKRLMKPYIILKKDGFDVLFTGIVTEKVADALKKDNSKWGLPTHFIGNKILSFAFSILFNVRIDDMETCYKCFTRNVLSKIRLKENDFRIEPEITSQIILNGFKIKEIPIKYHFRTVKQGKKISWIDGIKALFAIILYRVKNV